MKLVIPIGRGVMTSMTAVSPWKTDGGSPAADRLDRLRQKARAISGRRGPVKLDDEQR